MTVDACEVITRMDTILLADSTRWTKHTRYHWNEETHEPQMCLLGALSEACVDAPNAIPATGTYAFEVYQQVAYAICDGAGISHSTADIIEFNDAPHRKFADVKLALQKARQALCS